MRRKINKTKTKRYVDGDTGRGNKSKEKERIRK